MTLVRSLPSLARSRSALRRIALLPTLRLPAISPFESAARSASSLPFPISEERLAPSFSVSHPSQLHLFDDSGDAPATPPGDSGSGAPGQPRNGDNGDDGDGHSGKGKKGSRLAKKKSSKSSESDRKPAAASASQKSEPELPEQDDDADQAKKLPESADKSIEKIQVPKDYPQLMSIPLTRRPLFPGFYKSLYITDPQVIAAINNLMQSRQPYVGIFLAKDEKNESDVITNLDQVHKVGVFCQITNVYQSGPDNSAITVVVFPHRRIRASSLIAPNHLKTSAPTDPVPIPTDVPVSTAVEFDPDAETAAAETTLDERLKPYLPVNYHLANYNVSLTNVENMEDEPYTSSNSLVRAITSEILNVLKEISQLNPLLRDQIVTFSINTGGNAFQNTAKLADFVAAVSSGDPKSLQEILESLVIEERLHKALVLLKRELSNVKLQHEIARNVEKQMTKKQQEYYLMEQMKGIKKELGLDSDGKDKLVEKFKERVKDLKMPEPVKKVFDEELNKLQHLEPAASEFNVTRNYLDWLTQIPFGKYSTENFDIQHARTVLDEDHYGLKDVKDRILEFIAVGKLRGTVEGKIICLQGPPGVGKTSVGKSIARALGREFFRFSVGGLSDVAEIKGHRRTYVGAMPGKVIQALKKVQTENPLIMIDEIDKIGKGHQGDPASALLELLDPEQNSSFLDHYMDVPIDLSKVLFVCTANLLETIPGPLLDRMEVITLSGYVSDEKVAIARNYLSPQSRESSGLTEDQVLLEDSSIESLIKNYCRESGVRNLKKHIEKVYRKAALKIVQRSQNENVAVTSGEKLVVTVDNLKDYVGPPVYTTDRMYDKTPAGVVMGLAWTSLGGSVLYIESVLESVVRDDSKPSFRQTGQMGDVMKESTAIAYTYARSLMSRRFPENQFFDKAAIHMHIPEGATPKDGPSAGVTMTTSLLSLALSQPIRQNVSMTGEITLTGKVLKIGGVKEKTIAAKRSGVELIILPHQNKADWEELPANIKEGLEAKFVSWYDEIFDTVFEFPAQ